MALTVSERNKMALTYGLVIGFIYLIMTSAINLMVGNLINFYLVKSAGYILYFVIIGIFAAKIRKANGGYIEFRDIFGPIFIMILVAGFMSYLYSYLYIYVIDPRFMEKYKMATLHFMEGIKSIPQEKIDETARKFDEELTKSQHFNIGTSILGFFGFLIFDSLFGLIVGAIVKKKQPQSMTDNF